MHYETKFYFLTSWDAEIGSNSLTFSYPILLGQVLSWLDRWCPYLPRRTRWLPGGQQGGWRHKWRLWWVCVEQQQQPLLPKRFGRKSQGSWRRTQYAWWQYGHLIQWCHSLHGWWHAIVPTVPWPSTKQHRYRILGPRWWCWRAWGQQGHWGRGQQ